MLKYRFKETQEIKKLLIELEAFRILFEQTKILPHVEENLRRASLLKSALFSARVEGNPLSLEKIEFISEVEESEDLKKLEVFNLLRAYRYIYGSRAPKKLSLSFIKKIHQIAMKNISSDAGKFRNQPWAIFNQAGVVVYLAPAAFRLPELMEEFIRTSQKLKNEIPVKAAVLQFLFEKVHPFTDGNGRVGRLISTCVMNQGGYGFRGMVSMEEIIDKDRENYYLALEPSQDATLFVEFFLRSFITAFKKTPDFQSGDELNADMSSSFRGNPALQSGEDVIEQAKSVFSKLSEKEEELPEDFLLPRRREILEIIKDHPYCTFDLISRRFPAINPKTLHYDLKQLQEKGFIIKAGKTRGVTYRLRLIKLA